MRHTLAWARLASAIVTSLLVGLLAACASAPAGAKITTERVWARPAAVLASQAQATPVAGQGLAGPTSALYMIIKNAGRDPDRLTSASTEVARAVEMHETKMDGGVMRMGQVTGIDVPGGGQVDLKPSGYHVMLIGIQRELREGETFPVTLQFEKSGPITVQAEVRQS